MDIDRLKENIDSESYNITTESGEQLVVIEKDRLFEIVDMIVKESDSLPCVVESKTFDIHNCINDIEKVIKANTNGWFFNRWTIRFQTKKAIDKMLYPR